MNTPKPMHEFPPIVCISLQRSAKRRAEITQQLDALGKPWRFFDAHDGQTLDLNSRLSPISPPLRQDKFRRKFGRNMTRGEIGCYLSHYSVWHEAAVNKTPATLVFEDDADWAEDFAEVVHNAVNISQPWDIILLCFKRPRPVDFVVCKLGGNQRQLVRHKVRTVGAAAYLISHSGAEKLMQYCTNIETAVDMAYSEFWRNGLDFYGVHPPMAWGKYTPGGDQSDIGAKDFDGTITDRITGSLWRKCDRLHCLLYRLTRFMRKDAS